MEGVGQQKGGKVLCELMKAQDETRQDEIYTCIFAFRECFQNALEPEDRRLADRAVYSYVTVIESRPFKG